jgi:SAM-dependent methyltransferase
MNNQMGESDGERAMAISGALQSLHIDSLRVEVAGASVYIRGIAPCYDKKREAGELAARAAPGACIENELRVGQTASASDADVLREVAAAIRAAAPAAAERIGVEVNPVTRDEAAQAGIQAYPSLQAIGDQTVDVVISNHALEHVLAPHDVLVELRRVVRSSGRLVICVPADDWRNARQWRPGDPNHHLFAWTPLTLGNLLTEAGFAPVSVRMRNRAWPRDYVRLYRRLPRPVWEAVCLLWAIGRRRREIIAVAVPVGPTIGRPDE